MRIAGCQPITVVNIDHVAVFGVKISREHHAVSRCNHRRSDISRKIETFMHRTHAGNRIDPVTKRRTEHRILDRQNSRQKTLSDPFFEQAGLDNRELIRLALNHQGQAIDLVLQLIQTERRRQKWPALTGSFFRFGYWFFTTNHFENTLTEAIKLQHFGLQLTKTCRHQL